jgi:phospholipase/carboxylesterase
MPFVPPPRLRLDVGIVSCVRPIGHCSRRLVSTLRDGGHDVMYGKFDGGHDLPPERARQAIACRAQRRRRPPGGA